MGRSHWVHCEKDPAQAVFLRQLFNLPQELLKQFFSAITESVLCNSITVWFSSATKSDLRRLWRVVRTAERIIGTTLPTLQKLYLSRVSKRAGKITRTPYIQHTPSLNCYRLINATELWAPERPDTETVSSLRQSISWTLDIKRGPHNNIIILFIHHTYLFFHFNFSHQTCSHIFVYIVYFVHCLFVYCYFVVCVLSCCCHSVALWSFCQYNKFLICENIPGQ